MLLLSGKNSFICIMRWKEEQLPLVFEKVPFRLPYWFSGRPNVIQLYLDAGMNVEITYGFHILDVGATIQYPSPPVDSIMVNTTFGVEPNLMLGKIFSLDFRPSPIEGRNVVIRGKVTTEFLTELLYPLAVFTEYRRRFAFEPTPIYGIQVVTVSHLPEFSEYVHVIEVPVAVPQRIVISADSNSFVSFEVTYFTPYASWYISKLFGRRLPSWFDPVYSENVYTIREVEVGFTKGSWWEILGFPYSFSFTANKEITPVYTFPAVAGNTPLVAREWGSVAQSIREGPFTLELDLTYHVSSDATLPLGYELLGALGGGHMFTYSRQSFPFTLRLSPFHLIEATAQVVSLTSTHISTDALRIAARILLAEPIGVTLTS